MKILITAPFSEAALSSLKEADIEIDYRSWLETGKLYLGASLLPIIQESRPDILIVEGDEIKEAILEDYPLKLVGSVRNNPNNIDVALATKKGIPVLSVPCRNTIAVAELAIGLMLNQLRNMVQAERLLKSDFFVDDFNDFANMYTNLMGSELHNRKVGIIGLGSIGIEVAKRLRSFGSHLLIYDPYVTDERVRSVEGSLVDLETLLCESDIVSVHCTPTEETRHMLGRAEIALMKKYAILINTARASIIDEDALYEALKSQEIAGAGLDVFSMEPVDCDNRFLELDNVTVMPHMGGNTRETIERQSASIATDVLSYIHSIRPKNVLNPEVYD